MPEPVLTSIAAALAAKAVGSLYDLVKKRFARKGDAQAVLEAATAEPESEAAVTALAERLAQEEAEDPEFGAALRTQWQQVRAERGGVVNQVTGTVSGKVVQARDIHGDVSF